MTEDDLNSGSDWIPVQPEGETRDHSGGGEPESGLFWKQGMWWRRVGVASAGVWASSGFSVVATIIAARSLGATDYGRVVLAVAIAGLVSTFLDLTLEEAVVHHGSRSLVSGDFGRLRALLRVALGLDLAIGIGVSALVFLAAGPLAGLVGHHELSPHFVQLAVLTTLARTMDGVTGAVLLLAGRPDVRGLMGAFGGLITVFLVLVAAQFDTAEAVLLAFAAAALLQQIVQGHAAWRYGWRHWAKGSRVGDSRGWLKVLLPFGMFSSVTTSLTAMTRGILPIILGRLAGPTAVGVFDVALFPARASNVASGPLRLALLPEQARLSAEGRWDTLFRATRLHTLAGLAIGIPAAIAGWFVLPWLLPLLYSGSFTDSILPAQILLIAAASSLSVSWSKTFPAAIGRPGVRTAVVFVQGLVTIGLVLLLSRHAALGAAIALSVTSLLTAIAWLPLARRLLAAKAARDED